MATWFEITFTGEPTETDFARVAELAAQGFTSGQLVNEPGAENEEGPATGVWVNGPPLQPGDPIPPERNAGRTGFVAGNCGHAVAGSEWRAGFRNCEHCGEGPDDDEDDDWAEDDSE